MKTWPVLLSIFRFSSFGSLSFWQWLALPLVPWYVFISQIIFTFHSALPLVFFVALEEQERERWVQHDEDERLCHSLLEYGVVYVEK